jgi:hypothetical protein
MRRHSKMKARKMSAPVDCPKMRKCLVLEGSQPAAEPCSGRRPLQPRRRSSYCGGNPFHAQFALQFASRSASKPETPGLPRGFGLSIAQSCFHSPFHARAPCPDLSPFSPVAASSALWSFRWPHRPAPVRPKLPFLLLTRSVPLSCHLGFQ